MYATIGDGVKTISDYAFNSCVALESVKIGSKVENVGFRAFYGCTSLNDINWSNNIRSYGGDVFYGCTALTYAELSSSLESMDSEVFKDCINITSIKINEGCAVVGSQAFAGCTKLASVEIPNSVTTLGSSAFSNCKALVYATIGSGVRIISDYAFNGCAALEKVAIGSKVTKIGFRAFYGCEIMNSFTCASTEVPSAEGESFSHYNAVLFVPASAVDAYKEDKVWGKFNRIETLATQAYLIIKQGSLGAVKIAVTSGESYVCNIEPAGSAKVTRVTYNGTDVTSQLANNTYTIPSLIGEGELVITYDSEQSSGSGIKGDVNGDTLVNAADVVDLVNILMNSK